MYRLCLLWIVSLLVGCSSVSGGVVKLQTESGHKCSAFLVDSKTALTAKHCVENVRGRIFVLDSMTNRYYVKEVIRGDKDLPSDDFAVITFNHNIYSSHYFEYSDFPVCDNIFLEGFISGERYFKQKVKIKLDTVGSIHLESVDIKEGMSGGPLFCEKKDGTKIAFGVLVWRIEGARRGGASRINGLKAISLDRALKNR